MSDFLHAMDHDMSLNNAYTHDAYEYMGNIYSPDSSLSMLSDSDSQLYRIFSSRLESKVSSSDFTNLSNMRDDIVKVKNKIENYLSQNNYYISPSSYLITNQWKIIQEFYIELGNNINKLQ